MILPSLVAPIFTQTREPGVGAGPLKDLFARHRYLDRMAGPLGQKDGRYLMVERKLAAESAADLHGGDADMGLRDFQGQCYGVPELERSLCAHPDMDPVIVVPQRCDVHGLDVALMYGGGVELPLKNEIGRGKSFSVSPILCWK